MMILSAPLEQFQILPVINLIGLNYIITNFLLVNALSLLLFFGFFFFNSPKSNSHNAISLYFLPQAWQKSLEFLSEIVANVARDSIPKNNEKHLLILATLFNFILFNNLIGLVPYSFTATSHLIVTFTLAFSIFFAINVVTIKKYKIETFSLFLPAHTSFFLAMLLVPVEFISYLAKPISLAARLFINLMASHSTLKIIIGFSWAIMLLENVASLGFFVPMLLLIVLLVLELGIALIQTYVFVVLVCVYISNGQ